MNSVLNSKTIENVVRRSDIRFRNDMTNTRRLAKKPHCNDGSELN